MARQTPRRRFRGAGPPTQQSFAATPSITVPWRLHFVGTGYRTPTLFYLAYLPFQYLVLQAPYDPRCGGLVDV